MKKKNLVNIVAGMMLTGFVLNASPVIATEPVEPKKAVRVGTKWVIDKIIARVNGANVLKSDLERPQVGKEGGFYTLNEFIGEELLFQRAHEKHLLPTSTDIDRQIVSFKMQLNLNTASNEQFEEHLKEYGFTLASYRKQLGRLLAVNNAKQAEISEKVLITSQEVEDYYQQNPATIKEKFHLSMGVLDREDVDNYKSLLAQDKLTWKDFGFVDVDELDPRYAAATKLTIGAVTPPIEVNNKYVVIKLIAKEDGRILSLEERYGDIEKTLQLEKRTSFGQSFQEELLGKAFISFP